MSNSDNLPAGWYPDPVKPQQSWRHWNGQNWTGDVRDVAASNSPIGVSQVATQRKYGQTSPQPALPASNKTEVAVPAAMEATRLEQAPVAAAPPPPPSSAATMMTAAPAATSVGACPDCGGKMSNAAPNCIHCGRPNGSALPPPTGNPGVPGAPYVAGPAQAVPTSAAKQPKTKGFSATLPTDLRTLTSFVLGLVTILFAYSSVNGRSIGEFVTTLALIIVTLALASGARKRAAKRGEKPSWLVVVARILAADSTGRRNVPSFGSNCDGSSRDTEFKSVERSGSRSEMG